MRCDVPRHQRGAAPLGLEGADLLVDRADLGTLTVIQDGHADGARNMVVQKFAFRPDINDHAVWPVQPVLCAGNGGRHREDPFSR